MSIGLGESPELAALGEAIGLLDGSGNLDPDWFGQPLTRLAQAVGTPQQRDALVRFVNLALPPVPEPGRPAGETWHSLLGTQDRGNLYLTLNETATGLVLGVAGDVHTGDGAPVPASLRIQGDLIAAGGSLDVVAGTTAHPLTAELRVQTGWAYAPPTRPIGLQAVTGRFTIVPDPDHASVSMQLVLEQLSLNGEPPADTVMDVAQLGAEAPILLAALLKVVFAEVGADPELTRLADHLLALLGLAGPGGVPAFPFAALGSGPAAIQAWLREVLGAGDVPASAAEWLEHLAGMLGSDVAATGDGTADAPWQVTLASIGGGEVYATLALVGGRLRLGAGVSTGGSLGAGHPELTLSADAAIIDVSLAGAGSAVVLPQAAVQIRATGPGGGQLVAGSGSPAFHIGSIVAGIRWDGTGLVPSLVLLDNQLGTQPYPRLDLSNADSVAQAATDAVVTAITDQLGAAGAGRRLAAIAGLVAPEDPANPGTALPGWSHQLNLADFVINPATAIGRYHRDVLRDGSNWAHILREISLLIGLGEVSATAGTAADPWTVAIAGEGSAQLQLAAWHQPAAADATVEQLRLGLRLAATPGGATVALVSEVLTFDLPASGPAHVAFLGAQELQFVLHPAVDAQLGAAALSLDTLDATAGWSPGGSLGWQISAQGLTVSVDGESVTAAELHLPPAQPFDFTDLNSAAAALGLSLADLIGLIRMVLVLLADQAGPAASLGAALLGLHAHLPGMSEDTPPLIDPADPGLLLRDPLAALRDWLGRLTAHTGTSGQASLIALLRPLGTLGTDLLSQLGGAVSAEVTDLEGNILGDAELALADLLGGAGSFGDPWRIAWPGAPTGPAAGTAGTAGNQDALAQDATGPELELWLEPAGPPSGWLSGLATRAQQASAPEDLAALLRETAWFDPQLRSLLRGLDTADLLQRLISLEVHLGAGDGVVPRDSQAPDVFGWVPSIEVDAAHHLLPSHPDVIGEVLTRIEQLRAGGPRTVLLIGPDFTDHTAWAALLAAPALQGTTDPGAQIDLRVPGIDPPTISLDGLTTVADYYTADLAAGDAAFQAAQLAHIADRLAQLHPGPIVVVAHSTAGLAARQFAADHPDRVAGLITLDTPHLGAPLPFLSDPALGDAVRLAAVLAPQLPASPLADALGHLAYAVEGYRPASSPGTLDIPDPYPASAFTQTVPFDLGDVPVVMISGGLTGDVIAALASALAAHAQTLAAAPRPDPTHLSYGMAMPVSLTTAADAPSAGARVRYGLGQIPLSAAPPEPPRPARLLRVELDLVRQDGWLVGGPGLADVDGRLRALRLGVTATGSTGGGAGGGAGGAAPAVHAVLDARLDQAAWRGTTVASADLADPRATPLIGAAVAAALAGSQGLAPPPGGAVPGGATGPAVPGPAVSGLAAALAGIGLAATDAAGVTGLSADAFAALRTDPVGYLGARIPKALAASGGWAGLIDVAGDGSYHYAPPGSPYGLFARPDGAGWRTGIETTTELDLPLWVSADIDLALPDFAPDAELAAHLGVITLRYHTSDQTVTLDADPFVHGLTLLPAPTPAQLGADLGAALPDVLATGVLGAVLGQIVPGLDLAGLSSLVHTPGQFLARVLGGASGLDLTALSGLLATLNAAIGLPAGPGVQLPGGLSITATAGTGAAGSVALGLSTTAPIEDVLGLALAVEIDPVLHASAAGTVTVEIPLGEGAWHRIGITFGAGPSGMSLVLTPDADPPIAPITLLPQFSGLGPALRGAAAALLPQVLDQALDHVTAPHAAWLDHALEAAGHLDLYDVGGGFAAHAASFTAMLAGTWFDSVATTGRTGLAQAVIDLLTLIPGLPGTLDAPGAGLIRWRMDLPSGQGQLALSAGWGVNGPAVSAGIIGLHPAGAPAELTATASADRTGVDVGLSAGADLSPLGVPLVPQFSLDLDTGGHARARLLPLATGSGGGTDDGPLVITLAPSAAVTLGSGTAEALITGWALPLAAQVALAAAQPALTHPLWTGGPTLTEALTGGGILGNAGQLADPLPGVFAMLAGFAASAAGSLDLPVGDLHLTLAGDSGRLGLGLRGEQAIPLGDLELDVLFGAPAAWGAHAAEGLQVLLLDTSGASHGIEGISFAPGLRMHGVGLGLARSDGTPLVAETAVRLGSLRGYLFLDLDFPGSSGGSLTVAHAGAGAELGGFGLPLSAALSGAGGGSNSVASDLLASGGSGGSSGDGQSVNPAADIDAWYWDDGGAGSPSLHVLVGGQEGLLWIPIQAGFGPIFIDQLGVGVSDTRLTLAIDGGVSIAGLTADVDDLSVAVPYRTAGDPSTWILDLKGLAVGYSGPSIDIAGGLVKFDGPPLEYDGMLLIEIASIGAVVIGSYAEVSSGSNEFTSLAIFGGVFVPIGIPPIINLTGFALGLGYNRRLIVPDDLNQIPSFFLVQALDRPDELANNPMQALYSFRQQVPPARGALWVAAGLRGTTFEIINVTAVVYVALNNGMDVGLLGVARMELPADDAAVVSVELALKARFSSAEGLFSEQAQLTDNSWLISQDCRLTGGFAFFSWFRESQFLFTIGGYHPSFVPRPEYPVVPRVGYEWNFLGVVHLKGESYFALTTTAIMTGSRVEATYGPDWIQVWFTAYFDVLVTRDPFHYELDIGVSVGARLRIEVCFFACVHIEISVSVGASLHLAGPPFHGTVTADLGVTSVTVPFGDDALPAPPPKHWDEFVALYVRAADPNAASVSAQIAAGLMPAEPAGGPVAPGTSDQPWRLSAEWSLRTETKMPARGFALQLDTPMAEGSIASVVFGRVDKLAGVYDFDLAPMYVTHDQMGAVHRIVLARRPEAGGAFVVMVPDSQPPPADATMILRHSLFRVTPVLSQVSEATYHYFPDLKPPAAANTLPVLTGLQLDGVAGLRGQSATVPIGTLVDASNFRPLPFASRSDADVARILQIGSAWQTLATVASGVPDPELVRGVAGILGGTGEFAGLRADSGLPAAGYGPVALDALASRRSAAPVLSALSEGFTLHDVGQGLAPAPVRVGPLPGVPLTAPRLRTVMQRPLLPAATAPAVRTTLPATKLAAVLPVGPVRPPVGPVRPPVGPVHPPVGLPGPVGPEPPVPVPIPVINVRNDLVTSWETPGLALLRHPAANTPQPTRPPRSARTLRNPAQGGPTGRAAAAALDELTAAAGKEVTVRAGVTHVWELPPATSWNLVLSGTSAVRVTALSTAGTVLDDRELAESFLSGGDYTLSLPPGAGMLAVTALGQGSAGRSAISRIGERGAVTGAVTAGGRAVLGWESGGQAIQVGPSTLLARGAVLRLGVPGGPSVRGHVEASGVVPISSALAGQQVTGTELPRSVTVAGVLLDSPTDAMPGPDDILVNVDGATADPHPVQVVAGRRALYLYDVAAVKDAPVIVIAAGVTGSARLAGVLGSTGTAAEWAAALAGSTLTQLVPDEHLTPDGALTMRLEKGGSADG
jgi:hypothetical protein